MHELHRDFRVKVEYLSSDGPCILIKKVRATTHFHAIELAYSELHTLQPNRAMYEVYKSKKSNEQLEMKRIQQRLAEYAMLYTMTYS